ncbi:MAG: GGDEF domain-containing protein, partial [Syntrophomonadaceae bacterium]|nr:GGDEF domain-containing protein [Syntrophomonadaceae bacterium]
MDYQLFLGILLIASGGTALTFGLYATNGVFKIMINRLLIMICSALLVWSLGLSITVSAFDAEMCLLGHMLAPIGWGPMSGLLLHFTLLLTGKDDLLKKWWFYPLLYLPGLLMVYAFTVLPAIGLNIDSFTHTVYGWAPVVEHDGWDYFFYTYYIGFTVVNLTILLFTSINSHDENKSASMKLIAVAYILAYVLGTLSDTVLGHFNIIFPQISPVFSLLPVLAMVYSVRRYGLLVKEDINQSETILTSDVRKNINIIMGIIFASGSLINIIGQKWLYSELGLYSVNGFSLFLLFIAAIIIIVNKLRTSNDFKELLFSILFCFIIPTIIIRFIRYGSITIWAFIFILLLISLLYNKRTLLIAITISSFMTQILVWVKSPAVLVEVNEADYIVRLAFIAIAAALSFYINQIYAARLKINSIFGRKQKLLSDISRYLLAAEEQNIDERVYYFLEQCGSFFKCDRALIVLFDTDSKEREYYCEWLAEGISSVFNYYEKYDSDIVQELFKQFEAENVVNLPDSKQLHPISEKLHILSAKQNVRALVALPVKEQENILGLICFNSTVPLSEWESDPTDFIEIVASAVSDKIVKIKKDEKIEFLAYHDQLTGLPNRILFKDRLEQAIKQAKRTEKMIGVVFIDLDSFKSINDTMGHEVGDMLLSAIAQKFSHSIRSYDTIARFGGDEFVIMLNQLFSTKDLVKIMDKLMAEIHKPVKLPGQEIYITASAGVALYPQNGEDADTLIKNADIAMYSAKEIGKNRYVMCSQDMQDQVLEKLRLTNGLYRALEREQLEVYYQPQVNLEKNTIVGVEALLRWLNPEIGMIGPTTFIPLAEQAGL